MRAAVESSPSHHRPAMPVLATSFIRICRDPVLRADESEGHLFHHQPVAGPATEGLGVVHFLGFGRGHHEAAWRSRAGHVAVGVDALPEQAGEGLHTFVAQLTRCPLSARRSSPSITFRSRRIQSMSVRDLLLSFAMPLMLR